jgi:hypothetical protein
VASLQESLWIPSFRLIKNWNSGEDENFQSAVTFVRSDRWTDFWVAGGQSSNWKLKRRRKSDVIERKEVKERGKWETQKVVS